MGSNLCFPAAGCQASTPQVLPSICPSFTLHCSLVAGALGPGGERLEPGARQPRPVPPHLPAQWLCLSSAGVAAAVEGSFLRSQASKEGVQQGFRQCDALGGVKF